MMFRRCPREPEIEELVDRGQWPAASDEELRAHAASCRPCRELILVKQALGPERTKAAGEARLEPAGVLWWRAQLRRRHAALERIARPFLGAQIFALAVCLAAAGLFVFAEVRRGFNWLAWIADFPRALHLGALMPGPLAKSPWELWLALSVAAMLALMGGAIVFFGSEKR